MTKFKLKTYIWHKNYGVIGEIPTQKYSIAKKIIKYLSAVVIILIVLKLIYSIKKL
jgi:hypothetical protein